MFNMSSFKVVLNQWGKSQDISSKYALMAWHQAVTLAASEHRNLAPLNMLLEAVHKRRDMVVMPLKEAIEVVGGKTKDFPGMIAVDIVKNPDKTTTIKAHARKWSGEEKELYKDSPLVSDDMVAMCKHSCWWDIAKPEKVMPPVKFSAIISAVKKVAGAENSILTDAEWRLLANIETLICNTLGREVFESKRG